MHTARRSLLNGLAAAGLAVSSAGWIQAASASTTPAATPTAAAPANLAADSVLAVTSAGQGSALDMAFVAGVQAAGKTIHTGLQGLDSAAFNRLGQLLADGQDTVLIGLLDDASATLVLDLVRSAGGRVLSEQHHRVDASAASWAQNLGQSLASGSPMAAQTVAAGSEARVSFRCMI